MSLVLQALFHRKSTTRKDGKSRKLYWLVWREFWNNFSGMLMLTHIQDDVNTKLLLEQQWKWESLERNNAKPNIRQARKEQRQSTIRTGTGSQMATRINLEAIKLHEHYLLST